MMKLIKEHKTTFVVGIVAAILAILIAISQSIGKNPSKLDSKVSISQESFQTVDALPTLPPAQGGGLNEKAQEVETSTQEIDKLQSKLPYRTTVELPDIPPAIVGIPSAKNLDNRWTLIVYVEADFQSPEGTPEYETNKRIFLEAAKTVHDWIIAQGADPEKIFIQWGDDEYTQQRAKEWLK